MIVKTRIALWSGLLFLTLALLPHPARGNTLASICRVRQGATGAGDGSSWTDAYPDLQAALANLSCTELWVAAGTYTPGGLRTDTFQLRDGLGLYGGFAGNESSRLSRDMLANETVLSGEIGTSSAADNSYHVVTGSGAVTNAVLDGFTISDGYADGANPADRGGGMYTSGGTPLLRNVTFRDNFAYLGGAMHNVAQSDLAIEGALFLDNSARAGGAIYNKMSNITVVNGTFSGNQATNGSGGGIFNSYSNVNLNNLTFTGNSASSDGGAIFNATSAPFVRNTILWGDTANGSGPEIIDTDGSATFVADSVVEGGFAGSNIITADPLLGSLGDYGGRMRAILLAADSPAVDAGSGCAGVDQRGLSRLGQGSGCDIGAFEFQPVVYAGATGRTTGFCNTWSLACELRYALAGAYTGQEIWVQAGTHYPTDDGDRYTSFNLKNGVALYGGFSGVEAERATRNWTGNPTILSGDIGAPGNAGDNSEHVVNGSYTDASAILDGFQVKDGYAITFRRGGGMYIVQGSPTVRNTAFALNRAVIGGGMNLQESTPVLENVWFEANEATHGGGLNSDDSAPLLDDVTFYDNLAHGAGDPDGLGNGGGMRCETGSRPALVDVTFTANRATGNGGGLYTTTSCDGTLLRVTLSDNTATVAGGGMANDGTAPGLTAVTFEQNQAEIGGGLYNQAGAAPIVAGSVFTANRAIASAPLSNQGGAIYNRASNPQFTDVTISANVAGVGGGMFNEQSSPQLTDVTFADNEATNGGGMYNGPGSAPVLTDLVFSGDRADKGGGIYNGESSPTLLRVLFEDEYAGTDGGAMLNRASKPILTDVIFRRNQTGSSGGGAMYNFENSVITGTNVTFVDNSAAYGGAIWHDESNGLLENATFAGNQGILGGALNVGYGALTVNHATFTENHATNVGGAILVSQSTLEVQNSVIWGNTTGGADPQVSVSSGTPVFERNVIQGGCDAEASCSGTITADPRLEPLADYGGETPTVALGPGSSAVDMGTGLYSLCPESDQRGMSRPVGSACDIGAFERVELTLVATLLPPTTLHLTWNDTTPWHAGYDVYRSSAPYSGYAFLHTPAGLEENVALSAGPSYYAVYGRFDGTPADRSNRIGVFPFPLQAGN